VKNSYLFKALLTLSCPIWARSDKDWAAVLAECVKISRRYTISPLIFFLFCGKISTNTGSLGNWVQTLGKHAKIFGVALVFGLGAYAVINLLVWILP